MNFRKLISLLLCLILTISCVLPLVSCGDKDNDEDDEKTPGGTVVGGGNGTTGGVLCGGITMLIRLLCGTVLTYIIYK